MRRVRTAAVAGASLAAAIVLALNSTASAAQPLRIVKPVKPTKPTATAAKLLFSDEFDGTALNTNVWYRCYKWTVETDGCSNNPGIELEWYQPGNVSVGSGNLNLTARSGSVKAGYPYTSGMVTTGGKWGQTPPFSIQYGYVEVSAKVPSGAGMWPAIWLLPNDTSWPPEIDIMEYQGVRPSIDYVNVHYSSSGANKSIGAAVNAVADLSAAYHTYAVDWQPGYIAWYLDGREVKRVTDTAAIPKKAMYIVLNLAIGGWESGQLTPAASIFPKTFLVDYVRVWNAKP